MSNLFKSLLLSVSSYLHRLVKKGTVAWPWERIALPVCMPTSWLCFPARLWLWFWLSLSCRTARRRKKRGHASTSWSQKQKVSFLRLLIRRPNRWWQLTLNEICKSGRDRRKLITFYNWEFEVCVTHCLRKRLSKGPL